MELKAKDLRATATAMDMVTGMATDILTTIPNQDGGNVGLNPNVSFKTKSYC
jgi:hypothetical protein